MPDEEQCTVEVLLNGHPHQVTVAGSNAPALGFETTRRPVVGTALLRFRCDVCEAVAKLPFDPPADTWRRPFVVRRVVHTP